jgi:hypothetical protein
MVVFFSLQFPPAFLKAAKAGSPWIVQLELKGGRTGAYFCKTFAFDGNAILPAVVSPKHGSRNPFPRRSDRQLAWLSVLESCRLQEASFSDPANYTITVC